MVSLVVSDTVYGFSDGLRGNQLLVDSSGNYYVVLVHKASKIVSVFKSTDSGANWSGPLGEASSPVLVEGVTNTRLQSIATGIFSNKIRMAYRQSGGNNFVAVVDFDPATNTWGTPSISTVPSIFQNTGGGTFISSNFQPFAGVVKPNGDVVIAVPGMVAGTATGWGTFYQAVFTVFSGGSFSAPENIVDTASEHADFPAATTSDGICAAVEYDPVTGNTCFLIQNGNGPWSVRVIDSSYSFVDSAIELINVGGIDTLGSSLSIDTHGVLTSAPSSIKGVAWNITPSDPSLTSITASLSTNLSPLATPSFRGTTVSWLHSQSLFVTFGAVLSGGTNGFVGLMRWCIPRNAWDAFTDLFDLPSGYYVWSICGAVRSDNLTYDLMVYASTNNVTDPSIGRVYYVTGTVVDSGCGSAPPTGWLVSEV